MQPLMMQLDLFSTTASSSDSLHRQLQGKLFYSVTETTLILGISDNQVRYMLAFYRLDALLIGGEYRIPWTALLRWIMSNYEIRRQYWSYKQLLLAHMEEPHSFYINKSLQAVEEDPADWYELHELTLPEIAPREVWAALIGISIKHLINDFSAPYIEWVEMYDWLTEKELVNLPILVSADDENQEQFQLFFMREL